MSVKSHRALHTCERSQNRVNPPNKWLTMHCFSFQQKILPKVKIIKFKHPTLSGGKQRPEGLESHCVGLRWARLSASSLTYA